MCVYVKMIVEMPKHMVINLPVEAPLGTAALAKVPSVSMTST